MELQPEAQVTSESEPKRGGKMVWAAIAGAIAFMLLAIIFASRFGGDPSISTSPLIGQPAPTAPVDLLDGTGEVSLADFPEDVIVVNYWASWCLSCRGEHPALLQAAADYEDEGVTFISINYQDTQRNAVAWLDDLGWSDETIYAVDVGSETAFAWGVLGIPETFFVDRDGIVVGKVSGPVSYSLLARTLDQIIEGESVGDIKTGDVENR
jgi:cytochrome c biogenesis protein CcmG/thiol:disulfide interchange protein DsbE